LTLLGEQQRPAAGATGAAPGHDATFRVALHTGLLIRHDAISYSALLKLHALRRWQRAGAPVEVTAFANGSDLGDPDVWVGHMGADYLQRIRHFDLHVFEFGIWFDLFDAVFTLDDPRRAIAVYHNITPPALLDDPLARSAAAQALEQKHNLSHVGHVLCDSPFNRDDLLAFGLPPEQLSVHPLPPARLGWPGEPLARRGHPGDPVQLLFVGRLVRPKGLLDLLDALDRLPHGAPPVHLTVAGNVAISDPVVVADVARRAERSGGRVTLAGRIGDDELERCYRTCDALVLPSYHEGFCVPVLEALAARCPVIAGDATNVPGVLGGLGRLVAPGDVDGLAAAIAAHAGHVVAARAGEPAVVACERGLLDEATWREEAAEHLHAFSAQAYDAQLRAQVLAAAAHLDRPGSRALVGWAARR
jgi:glycosyltransferase involved in cell wall biosynthesis